MDTVGTRLASQATDVHAPLVTIVIVNHNYGEFVERCIQSVDRQDYPNIHCIVLECASSDTHCRSSKTRWVGQRARSFNWFVDVRLTWIGKVNGSM